MDKSKNITPSEKRKKPLPEWKRRYSLSALSTLMPGLVRPGFKKHSAALAHLMTEWPDIIGPTFGLRCEPYKLSAGVLTINCSSTTAMELSYISENIIERINKFCGHTAIKSLRFIHNRPDDFHPPPKMILKEKILSENKAIPPLTIEGIEDGPLKEKLISLGTTLFIAEKNKKHN